MAVVVNKIPQLLEALKPDQAKAQAAEWVVNNGTFLKDVIDKNKARLAEAEIDK